MREPRGTTCLTDFADRSRLIQNSKDRTQNGYQIALVLAAMKNQLK